MTTEEYNYAVFDMEREKPSFDAFPTLPLQPGVRAPSFALEDLQSGEQVAMRDLWRDGLAIIEFGSFT